MKYRKLAAGLAVFALIVVACGGDANPTTTTETPPAQTTTTSPGETPDTTAPIETTTTEADPMAEWPEQVVFGFIPSERAESLQDDIVPFMDYLTEELGIEVQGVVTADYNGLVVAMGTEGADFGAFGPFGYVQAKDQFPTIEAFIQSVRFGSPTYHGQWFTNDPSICDSDPVVGALENNGSAPVLKGGDEVVALQVGWTFDDSGNLVQELLDDGTEVSQGRACIASLDSVIGKKVAFGSSTSTSAAVFPQLQLLNADIDIEADLTYEYLGSHDNTVSAVYNGDFDIGVSFDDARRNLREENPDVGEKVIVFNITGEIPNDVVAARGDLPESLKEAMFAAIEKYLDTEEGEEVLDDIYGWTSIRSANEDDFGIIRDAAEKLGVTSD